MFIKFVKMTNVEIINLKHLFKLNKINLSILHNKILLIKYLL